MDIREMTAEEINQMPRLRYRKYMDNELAYQWLFRCFVRQSDFPNVNTLNTVFHLRTSNMFLYSHSPINTTEGLLPKCWIIEDELRLLVKGSVLPSKQEALNEWLATQIANVWALSIVRIR